MLMNESCTIYIRNGHGFDRYFVPHCHWQESRTCTVKKSGLERSDTITVYVKKSSSILFPNGALYPCSTLFPGMAVTPKSPAKDMIIYGECDFIFDNSTPQSASHSLKALNERYDVHTVSTIERLLYGSEGLQHYKILAR